MEGKLETEQRERERYLFYFILFVLVYARVYDATTGNRDNYLIALEGECMKIVKNSRRWVLFILGNSTGINGTVKNARNGGGVDLGSEK